MRGEGRRARPGDAAAAADDGRDRRRVVRVLERRTADQRVPRGQQAGHRVHGGDLEGLLDRQRRQQPGEPLGEHRLARAGRAEQEQVVPSGGGDLDGGAPGRLPGDVGEVGQRRGVVGRLGHRVVGDRLAAQQGEQLAQRGDPDGVDAGQQAGLGEVGPRHDDPLHPGPGRDQDGRQHPADRADLTVEAELAEQHDAVERRRRQHPGRGEHGRRQGQVEAAAALGQRRRRQPEGDALGRPLLAGVDDGGAHPVAGLAEGGVGHAGDGQAGQALREVGLDLDQRAVEPDERDRPGAGERHQNAPRRCTSSGA